jgi:chemotaxis protein MotA
MMIGVLAVAVSERMSGKIGFIDWHAAVVVFGGVFAALLIGIEKSSLKEMLKSVFALFKAKNEYATEMKANAAGIEEIRNAWRNKQRAYILKFSEEGLTPELKVACDALLRRSSGPALEESFAQLRAGYIQKMNSTIEGWEMVQRLAPSFGMVGTVTGMVQLFRNMAEQSGNLGGAMAMALLATLYGIAFGATVGGPMSGRLHNQLNERLAMLDLLEKTVAALIADDLVRGNGEV